MIWASTAKQAAISHSEMRKFWTDMHRNADFQNVLVGLSSLSEDVYSGEILTKFR